MTENKVTKPQTLDAHILPIIFDPKKKFIAQKDQSNIKYEEDSSIPTDTLIHSILSCSVFLATKLYYIPAVDALCFNPWVLFQDTAALMNGCFIFFGTPVALWVAIK